jgi:hypothetical protein
MSDLTIRVRVVTTHTHFANETVEVVYRLPSDELGVVNMKLQGAVELGIYSGTPFDLNLEEALLGRY